MLTKEQANAVAESFLADQCAKRNAAAREIPRQYRSEELMKLEPYQREEVLRQAKANVLRGWRMYSLLGGWAVLLLATWFFLNSIGQEVPLFVFMFLVLGPNSYFPVRLVRKEAQALAKDVLLR